VWFNALSKVISAVSSSRVITPAVGVGGNVVVVGGLFLCIQIYSFTANLQFSLSFFHLN